MKITRIIIITLLVIVFLRYIIRNYINFPKYSSQLFTDGTEISNVMSETEFWKLIETSRNEGRNNYDLQCQILTSKLSSLPPNQIVQFNRTFDLMMSQSYNFTLWEAAFSLNGGCSDDCFEYFRSWLISLGKNKFYWTIKFPRLFF